jgi:hypothetical protein
MSKFLLPLVAAAAAFAPLHPAEAGSGYCGDRYGYGYGGYGYRSAPVVVVRDNYCYRPTYYRPYYAPRRVYYSNVDYCYPRARVYCPPRVSFFFGF